MSIIPSADGKVFRDALGHPLRHAPELLLKLAKRAGELAGWSASFDEEMHTDDLTWGAASFQFEANLYRWWYLAGESAIATVCYMRAWGDGRTGTENCLPMVRSFRWPEAERNA